tara:strand:+ start:84 stop:392 length:309 start_codon:yes stop_codon:yes gene_type:complete
MNKYFRKEFLTVICSLTVLISIYFSINLTFFSEKSITKTLDMNYKINDLKKKLAELEVLEKKLLYKIKFLSMETLNEDYISELAQKNLGLIKQDNVLVILNE